jgi:hypothetical protein
LGSGLVGAPPQRPCNDVGGIYSFPREAMCYAADFLDRPANEPERLVFLGVGLFAWCWMAAIMAKASMTRETWRCQPCQDLVSLWSRPNSFLAVSKLSSIAHR